MPMRVRRLLSAIHAALMWPFTPSPDTENTEDCRKCALAWQASGYDPAVRCRRHRKG